jgi:LacI family transcriptional regulator/LacI family asc operon transcriptional repressor
MNIYDVSEKAGVSIATVSRVLNGNTNVSDKTRKKILDVINELGYTPNVFARGLGLNTMKTIGIMCTDSSDVYLANAVYYLETELRTNGYDSILCCTGASPETKRKYLELLISKRVDALILVGSKFVETDSSGSDYIIHAAENIPIMLVNAYLDGENIYSTVCDDEAAVFSVTEQLLAQGRKNIVYLYTSTSQSGQKKIAGYKNALSSHNISVMPDMMHCCGKDILRARDYLTGLYQKGISFDAVVTSDDTLAVGALKFAYAYGICVPEQLSIVGYNNSILASCTQPELTSIDSRVQDLCSCTVKTLMGVFNGEHVPDKMSISADLIKRNTTNF